MSVHIGYLHLCASKTERFLRNTDGLRISAEVYKMPEINNITNIMTLLNNTILIYTITCITS